LEQWAANPGLTVNVRADSLGSISKEAPVYYKQIKVGHVKSYRLMKNDQGVLIVVVIQPKYKHLVKSHSRFWNVSGIRVTGSLTGLEVEAGSLATIVDGGIAFFTPEIKQKKQAKNGAIYKLYESYHAATLNGRLLYAKNSRGLNLKIVASDLGSIDIGTPIYYQKIPVGKITHFYLDKDNKHVILNAQVDKKYAHLVRENSRFWNASGFSATANLSGIKVRSESLSALMSGGIAFLTPENEQPTQQSKSGQQFQLYHDYESAKQSGVDIVLFFSESFGLSEGTFIKYQGIEIGKVKKVKLNAKRGGVDIEAILYGEAKHFAKVGSQFWVVKPKLGLAKTENLDTLVSGNFISATPGKGRSEYFFHGLNQAPMIVAGKGLHVILNSVQLGAIKQGDPVYYRQIKVGKVVGYELGASADQVQIHIMIASRYKALIRDNSQFWNMSGIDMDFSLWQGLKLKTSTLEAILEGGIGFATPDNEFMGGKVANGSRFTLHSFVEEHWLLWAPKIPLNRNDRGTVSITQGE